MDVGQLKGSVVINFGSVREAEKAIKALQGTFNKVAGDSKKLIKAADDLAKSQNAQAQAANKLAASNKQLTTSTSQVDSAEKARVKAHADAERGLIALTRAQGQNRDITKETQTTVKAAQKAIQDYRDTVDKSGAGSVEAARAQVRMKAAVDQAKFSIKQASDNARAHVAAMNEQRNATQKKTVATNAASKSTDNAARRAKQYSLATQDVTKSVQLALGPLSGVASRVTALTALFNTNAASIATAVGAVTGFIVAMHRSISVGVELETQLLQTKTMIDATGNSARFTAEQLNLMAENLGEATMTSAQEARKAQNILLTFGISSEKVFEDTLFAAQGLSRTVGEDRKSTRLNSSH